MCGDLVQLGEPREGVTECSDFQRGAMTASLLDHLTDRTMPMSLTVALLVIYIAGGVTYFWYHAYVIADTAVGAENRIRLFYLMITNPFWRSLEHDLLNRQTPEFRAYVSRVERAKYLWIAGAITLGLALMISEHSAFLSFILLQGNLSDQIFKVVVLYIVVGAACWFYLAHRIENGARLRLFMRMSSNPFWRLIERDALASQDANFRLYISRLELIKYCYLFGLVSLFVAWKISQ